MDTIQFTIMPDGSIKMETGKISGPSHLNAEQFLAEVAKLAGGKTKITRKSGHHHHHHGEHEHTHN